MQIFANNAFSTLASAILATDTTASLQPGTGAKFPAPTGGDFFLVTLFQLIGGIEANHEIVKVTARSVDTLTIVRAYESTTARAWGVGDQVSHRGTAGTLGGLAQLTAPANFTQPVYVPTAAPGTNTTQSASTGFVTAAVTQAKADLIASSPAALDTLNELALALGNDANFAATTATALGNRLRIDINTQGLNSTQKANAVTNLGLATVATTGLKADVGLGNVDNTSDVNKPVSTATQTALNLKANISSLAAVATSGLKADVGLANVDNTSDVNKPLSTAATNALTLKANLASPVFTSVDAVVTASFAGATGKLRIQGYASGGYGSVMESINTAGSAFLPITVQGTFARLITTDNSNSVIVSSAGVAVTGTASFNSGSGTIPGLRTIGVGPSQGSIAFGSTDSLYKISAGADYVGMYFSIDASKSFVFENASAEKMRLSAGGNLLIGTTTDNGARLQVKGSTAYGGMVSWQTSTATGTGYLYSDGTGAGIFDQTGVSSFGNGMYMNTTSNYVASYTNNVERTRLTATGNLLIGTATDDGVNKLQVAGSATVSADIGIGAVSPSKYSHGGTARLIEVLNTATTINSQSHVMLSSGATVASSSMGTVSWVMPNVTNATSKIMAFIGATTDAAHTSASPSSAITFATRSAGAGASEVMRIDASGNLLVGVTSGTNHIVAKALSADVGAVIFQVMHQQTGVPSQSFFAVSQDNSNAANTANKMGRDATTLRSLNAGGTINASGADYAEYMVKASGAGVLAKGSIVGVTAAGELTDKWVDSVSFVVKSTNPSYVGGDTWGVGLEGDALEAARATVDRIAFAGQVPVNVLGATPGDYILPDAGGSAWNLHGDPEVPEWFKKYVRSVGIVQNILPDGRANIRVKVA